MIVAKSKILLYRIRKALAEDPNQFLQQVTGVIHIGANVGQERNLYKKYDLDVIWIEPIPEVFTQLQANLSGYKEQRAFQYLVTEVDHQKYDFFISNNNGQSSSILDLKGHKEIWPNIEFTTTLSLASITLDSLLKKEQIDVTRYQALIMDTQGSEMLVLQGSLPVLKHFEFIKLEVPDFESYGGCCQLSDISAFMMENGYSEYARDKFASRAKVGSYFDIVYRNKTKSE